MFRIPELMVPVIMFGVFAVEVLGVFAIVYFAARLAIRHERRRST
jgi:hypothetical protein